MVYTSTTRALNSQLANVDDGTQERYMNTMNEALLMRRVKPSASILQ